MSDHSEEAHKAEQHTSSATGSEGDTPKEEKASPTKESKKQASPSKKGKGDSDEDKAGQGDAAKKASRKQQKDSDAAKSSDSEDDEEEEEPKLGLLDQPLEVSGSRERKKVERLSVSFSTPKEKQELPEGHGEKLGDCPRIDFQIQRHKTDDLRILHRLLYNRPGSGNEIKRNIRKFNGFPFKKGSPEYERKKLHVDKLTLNVLRQICEILDLEKGKPKDELVTNIVEFLLEPKASGRPLVTHKKSQSKGAKRKRGGGGGDHKKKKSGGSRKKKSDESSQDELNDESDKEDAASGDEDGEDAPSEPEEVPKPKKAKGPSKGKGGAKKQSEEKKSTSGTQAKKGWSSPEDSSEDEPLVTKKVKMPPTEEEIKGLIKKILDGANLEEITMKKVIKEVFDEYPDFDLTGKKDFIKATVRSIIS